VIAELELPEANAEAIIEKAIEFGVYTDDVPKTKKDKLAVAHEIVAFSIDSYVTEGVRPDSEDNAEAGQQIVEIFNLAGVEVDDDDEINYGTPPDLDDNGNDGGDDEAPVDIDDIIEGYAELTAATKLKKIKALELDPDDDDDVETLNAIADWEEAQEQPSSRVLAWLEEQLGEEVEGEAEPEADETADEAGDGEGDDEPYTEEELLAMSKDDLFGVADEFELEKPKRLTDTGKNRLVQSILEAQDEDDKEDDDDDSGDDSEGELEEPWGGYEDAKLADIKEVLNDDERTDDELEYIRDYEANREKPRQSIIDLCNRRIEELTGKGEDEPEEEPEPEEKKPAGRRRGRRGSKTEDPDDNDDVDNAVAEDDEKDARAAKRKKAGEFVVTADKGDHELEATFDGKYSVAGYVLDLIEDGWTSIKIES
jgi:hypothetical protein